ncbi:AMP-binding protein [Rhodococcus maanshanensis]|uniref:Acyl-CoA synthetase (AMP-forming)/AMP-acid ligase II n=1 Tax=Rhodococcus maanshanensis TaxID=183556 RepID=A0A1H7RRQ3_9NOCA|nr:AMP-binding protein [Rhodococcus maanshanensis]SEL62911.1 Acyl-CoA synthetase (AMP-forming)/AMP-acid ligase II [Rhodococcus maanshanensis]
MPSVTGATDLLKGLVPVTKAGIVGPMGPSRLAGVVSAWFQWDFTAGGLLAVAARRDGDRIAVIDDRGPISYRQLDEDARALAAALHGRGLRERGRIGILARNHRGFLIAMGASARLGTDLVLLNTGASTTQLAEVLAEQKIDWLLVDSEFTPLLTDSAPDVAVFADAEPAEAPADTDRVGFEDLLAGGRRSTAPLARRPRRGRIVVLTSGTTGTPKGANRPEPRSWMPASALLSRLPLRSAETTVVASPIFHTWGLAAAQVGLALRSTMVLARRFDPAATVAQIAEHRAAALWVVPTMLQRITDLPAGDRDADLSTLRVIAASGSAIPTGVVHKTFEVFGSVLYNFYGSTEVSWASIAQPHELRAHPTTAGRPPLGTVVRILDDRGNEVPHGTVGRVFVGNGMLFEGYTRSGSEKEISGGLMSTGDLGHFDPSGLLFLDGRSDDMIVSGGENVYPREVENLLSELPGVLENAVVGIDDPEFGARLAAYVVRTDDPDGAGLTEDGIKSHVKAHLARHCVPREVAFLDELPRNPAGKVVPRLLPKS